MPIHPSRSAIALFTTLTALTVLVYLPALNGGYVFDDGYYIVNNPTVHVTSLRLGDWAAAALSQTGSNQFRALSMLSFAANYYFTGLDPFWMKLTNVIIHLLNGVFLFLALREILRIRRVSNGVEPWDDPNDGVFAAVIAGIWLLLPINVTGVAYVAQRIESLANLFVFAGLWGYLRARREGLQGYRRAVRMWLTLATGMLLGLCAKESAALLPLYTACAEFALLGFRDRGGEVNRSAVAIHIALLLIPFIAGATWLAAKLVHGTAGFREFSITERLLTEPRVLVDYIHWILLPRLDELTFYHDDLAVSHGLLAPPTTLLSICALMALFAIALWQRRTRPLFCLGIFWFFAGHSMTATIIPLELVFEHRNYFPSAGLLLACGSLVLDAHRLRPMVKSIIAISFVAFCAFTTLLRAEEWSHPLRLAYSEAQKRPHSARAQYELARTLILAAGDNQQSPLIDQSVKVLERAAALPDSGIAPFQALIYLNGRAKKQIDPAWWQAIHTRLAGNPPSQTDIQALIFLYHCQMRGDCPEQPRELYTAFAAALQTSFGNPLLVSTYAEFAANELGDFQLAEKLFREVVASRPEVAVYRVDLARFLITTKQYEQATREIDGLQRLNHLGSLDAAIAELNERLQRAQSTGAPAASMQNH